MEVSVDTHLCIRCSQTIVGIEAYLEHRRGDCLGSSFLAAERDPLEPPLLPDDPELPDFFLSLDLQRINPVEAMESDIEDDEDPLRPPGSHTGGKWRPGSRPSIMQGMRALHRDRTPSPERLPLILEKMGCAPCGRIFRDKYTYQRHLESTLHRKRSLQNAKVLRAQERPVIAAQPPEILLEESVREQPVRFRRFRRTLSATEQASPTPSKGAGTLQLRCSICFKWFSNRKALKTHMSMHISVDQELHCSECRANFSESSALREHLKSHKEHRVCCGKVFVTVKGLREHKEAVHAAITEWLACPKCSKKFHTQRALRDHPCAADWKSFACSACDYIGTSKKNLKLHSRSHSQEKPYQCSICGYRAARHHQLWRHKKLHGAQDLHKCPYCDFACTLIENLRAHILKGKKHAGLKVYPCDKCSFSTNISLEAKTHFDSCHSTL